MKGANKDTNFWIQSFDVSNPAAVPNFDYADLTLMNLIEPNTVTKPKTALQKRFTS